MGVARGLSMFSHLDMRMDRLQLDLEAHGLIGITQHVKIDGHGNVIMSDRTRTSSTDR